MAWLWLVAAILSEVAGTSLLKVVSDHPRVSTGAAVTVCYAVSFVALAVALRQGLTVGVAYAVWSAVGTAAIVTIGVVVFGEPVTALRLACIGLIVAGVVGLQLTSTA